MKIPVVANEKKCKFYDHVLNELNKVPFGTYTKKDLECMILNALLMADIITTYKSRYLANTLEINEQKLKNLLMDIRYKYQPDNQKENVLHIIKNILANTEIKVAHDNGYFIFALENPVLKIDFEQSMKDVGYYSDSSFNKEIVKVKDYALVAFLFRFNNNDNTFEDLQKMKRVAGKNEKDLLSKIQLKKTWIEIGKDIISISSDAYSRVETLRKIALFITTGKFL